MSGNSTGPKVKGFWRQLFCDHIWKIKNEEPLSEHYTFIDDIKISGTTIKWALYQECLKCGKEKIETKRRPKNDV